MNQLVAERIQKFARGVESDVFKSKLVQALPPDISVDRFTRALLTAWQINPDILGCESNSVYMSVLTAAQQGLMPDGREGAIVKFGERAQFMPMVAGVIKRFAQAGVMIYADSVYSGDTWRNWNDEKGQHVLHEKGGFGNRGEWIGCYAVAVVDGQTYIEVADIPELKKIQAASRSGNGGPWKQWPERMGQKSMLHRLGRRVPLPVNMDEDTAERLAKTVNADREEFENDTPPPQEPPQQPRSRPRVFDGVATTVTDETPPESLPEPVSVDLVSPEDPF